MEWETVIGLEVHVQLLTKSKIFSGAATNYGALPNTQACLIDLAMPGVLPVLNEEALNMAIKLGLAINAEIAPVSVFARKNYFYPDLPKGYQISQYDMPVVQNGFLNIKLDDGAIKRINITRAHLEEDAGKSLHEDFRGYSGIDLNRAGTGLIEVVSEPDMRSAREAVAYLKKLHTLVCYLDICDGNMQEGSFRCDANVSVRRKGDTRFGTRAEIKNVNSFRFVERAINYEVERQIDLLQRGEKVIQETRLYDAVHNITKSMRSKEEANDYRYFPDPDLLPVHISNEMIEKNRMEMPELPDQKKNRFMNDYKLNEYDAENLIADRVVATFFENVTSLSKANPKLVANWIMVELMALLNENNLAPIESPISAKQFAVLMQKIEDGTISGKIAKEVFAQMWQTKKDPEKIIEEQGLIQISDTSEIEKIIDLVFKESPQQLADYLAGKDKLFGYFVGQTMKLSQGKANPGTVNQLLIKKLGEQQKGS